MKIMVEEVALELAYTAGIMDGEGSIMIQKTQGYTKLSDHYFRLIVVIANTDSWLIVWLHTTYGGYMYDTPAKPGCKPLFTWRITGKPAKVFLESILPYLHIKKPQAELAIKFQGNKKPRFGKKVKAYGSEELVLQEADRILMASLNKKGVE